MCHGAHEFPPGFGVRRRCGAFMLALALVLGAFSIHSAEPLSPKAVLPPVVQVISNGTVECISGAFSAGQFQGAGAIRYTFALPTNAPVSRAWLDGVPILETVWEHQSVRYTQRVLATRLGEGPLNEHSDAAVLMIQIAGQNLASEYTNAAASIGVALRDKPLPLELRGNRVYRTDAAPAALLGVLEVPGEGVTGTNGLRLRFQGSMPPGTSGTMTLKIPNVALTNDALVERLLDLAFEDEIQRLKKFWQDPAAKDLRPALGWGDGPRDP